ncbi:NADP-dependent oxidoreductase domain-containing protein [Haematococcus lacustris]
MIKKLRNLRTPLRIAFVACCLFIAIINITHRSWIGSAVARQSLDSLPTDQLPTLQEPVALLQCIDASPLCTKAQYYGRCSGATLLNCQRSCGLCTVVANLLNKATRMEVQEVPDPLPCKDTDPSCQQLQQEGLCGRSRSMLASCKATCGFCAVADPSSSPAPHPSPQDVSAGAAVQAGPGSGACGDSIDVCPYLASQLRLCHSLEHSWWMRSQCRRSCQLCETGSPGAATPHLHDLRALASEDACEDYHPQCASWKAAQQCMLNMAFMSKHCAASCGQCSQAATAARQALDMATMRQGRDNKGTPAVRWMTVSHPPPPAPPSLPCVDQEKACSGWASMGECAHNKGFMEISCRLACGLCSAAATAEPAVPLSSSPFWFFPQPLAQVQLNNGRLMPSLGFGTAGLGEGTQAAVAEALAAGYRHVDSAQAREWYREDMNGLAVAASGLPRPEVWLTTKIHPRHLGYQQTLEAFGDSLEELQTSYLDLVLLHYSSCWGDLCLHPDPKAALGTAATATPTGRQAGEGGEARTWRESWRALEELYRVNKTRAIGVSNFGLSELRELQEHVAQVKPQVLQVHVDPLQQQQQLLEYCRQQGIQVVAYSTLGTQWGPTGPGGSNPVLTHPTLQDISRQLQRSVVQVVLRWALQLGLGVLPRSHQPAHIRESQDVWDFELSEHHMRVIAALDGTFRSA